jgi:integrase
VLIPSVADIDAMEAQACLRDRALLFFQSATGIRPEALSKLKWSDIILTGDPDIPARLQVNVYINKGKGQGNYLYSDESTFLHKKAYEILEQYHKEIGKGNNEPIFWTYGHRAIGIPLLRWAIWDVFNELSKKTFGKTMILDINGNLRRKRYTSVNFRHLLATALSNVGASDIDVSAIIGHTVKSQNKVYIGITPSRITALMEIYRKTLSQLC